MSKNKKPTKRQHFVPRKYLKKWACNDMLSVVKLKKYKHNIHVNNLCIERNMFTISRLNKLDTFSCVDYIKDNLGYSAHLYALETMKKYTVITMFEDDYYRVQIPENLQTIIENIGWNNLDCIFSSNEDHINYENFFRFSIFIAMQYLRTPKMRKWTIDNLIKPKLNSNPATWKMLLYPFSMQVGESISCMENKVINIYSIPNNIDKRFFTSDNPVIPQTQIFPSGINRMQGFNYLYPIDPKNLMEVIGQKSSYPIRNYFDISEDKNIRSLQEGSLEKIQRSILKKINIENDKIDYFNEIISKNADQWLLL